MKACKEIGGYQPVTWLAGRDKSRYPQVYRTHPLESSNYGAVDGMIGVANQKWRESLLIARPAVQFRGFFPEVNNQNLTEIAIKIKETYNDYLKLVRSLEDLKNRHPELREPYIEVTSTKSQRTLCLTRLDRFGTLESSFFSQDKQFPVDLQLVNNKIDREIPKSLLAVATLDLEGKSVEQPIGAIALSSVEEYNLKAGINM